VQTRLAQDTGDAFHAIQEAIQQSKGVVTEISALSGKQLELTNNVEQAMEKVSEISALTLTQVKDSAAITTGLTEQSTVLLSSVDTFHLAEDE
jgi:methyl-accepting chemotaxis protein